MTTTHEYLQGATSPLRDAYLAPREIPPAAKPPAPEIAPPPVDVVDRGMGGSSFRGGIIGGALAMFVMSVVLAAYGCAKNGQGLSALGEGAQHSVKIESLAEQTKSELKPVRTNSDGKVRIKNSIEHQDEIIDNSQATRKAMETASKDHDKQISTANKKYSDLDGKWYVRAGRPIDRWLRILKWTVILVFFGGLALKLVGLNVSGFTGASFSYIGSGLLHMIPWVGGVLNEWFANAWFRDRQAKVAATAPKVVEVPTAVNLPTGGAVASVAGVQTTPDAPIAAAPRPKRRPTKAQKARAKR